MILAPVIERELRVSARNPKTYRYRAMSVGGVVCLGGLIMAMASFGPSPSGAGRPFFDVLSGLLLVLCLLEGARTTAECITDERRQGTLGLLFLTDLRGIDVVLGKLAAMGLKPLYSLLAVLPILSLAIPMGGVSGGDFWRMGIVLVSNLLFSLCLGLAVSAMTPSGRSAFFWAIAGLLILAGGPIAAGGFFEFFGPASSSKHTYALSPLYCYFKCVGPAYRLSTGHFWLSVSMGVWWAICGVVLASWATPRSLHQIVEEKRTGLFSRTASQLLYPKTTPASLPAQSKKWQPIPDGKNPATALFARPPASRGLLIATGLMGFLYAGLMGCTMLWDWPIEIVGSAGLAVAALLGIGIRIGLASQMAHDAAAITHEKFWETIATTPLTQAKILSALFRETLRLWLAPVTVHAIISIVAWIVFFAHHTGGVKMTDPLGLILGPGQIGIFWADLITIACFATSSALSTGKPGAAAVRAIVFTQVIPSVFCCWGGFRIITDQAFIIFALTRLLSDWRVLFEKRPR